MLAGVLLLAIGVQSQPFIGEIRMFAGNFAPRSWHLCDGAMMQIAEHTALFSILGTSYGGDGRVTFKLPDLRGRSPVGAGQGYGLTNRPLGLSFGTETAALPTVVAGTATMATDQLTQSTPNVTSD